MLLVFSVFRDDWMIGVVGVIVASVGQCRGDCCSQPAAGGGGFDHPAHLVTLIS